MIFSADVVPDLLIDTNILIYLSKGEENIVGFLERRREHVWGASVISYMEVLLGAKNEQEIAPLEDMFSSIVIVPISQSIGARCVETLKNKAMRSLREMQLPDLLIAHTAMQLGIPLVTNNPRDFRKFKGLEIVVP